MQPRRPARRLALAVAASIVTAGGVAAAAPAGASAAIITHAGASSCVAWTGGQQPPDPGGTDHSNYLRGVAVLSPCNAWAVGDYQQPLHTLIEHWNGASWTQVPSPDPGTEAGLNAVNAVSAGTVWAVGAYFDGTTWRTLVVRWKGASWTQVPSPSVSGASESILTAVRATSATDVWAVGYFINSNNVPRTLILHWNGHRWTRVPSPNPGGSARSQQLTGVAGVSRRNAWAVGFHNNGSFDKSTILHWNGHSWKQVKSPNPGTRGNFLQGVRATSAGNAWAVGSTYNGTADSTLIVHWNGSAWKRAKTPDQGGSAHNNDLLAITATSAKDAWAVGAYDSGAGLRTLALHWNGSAWRRAPTPNLGDPATDDDLLAVGASTAGSVWAVGIYYNGSAEQALAIHCC
jgi:hypothetical protein